MNTVIMSFDSMKMYESSAGNRTEMCMATSTITCTAAPRVWHCSAFDYIGKCFCIRGGEEQRQLGPSHFIHITEPDCYTYVEQGSKNRNWGPQQLTLEIKRFLLHIFQTVWYFF